jgi:hypothetical protein
MFLHLLKLLKSATVLSVFFFLKRRQKICLYLLIKKKRIAQLINGKPSENRYNTTNKRTTPKTCNLQTNKLSTYNRELTTPGAPRRSTKRTTHIGFITHAAAENFLATRFFLLLPQIETFLRDFSTILIMSSEAFPAKTQAMSLPHTGLAASKLASKPQSSVPKRALELCANTSPLTTEAGFCDGEGVRATIEASNKPRSSGSSTESCSHNS